MFSRTKLDWKLSRICRYDVAFNWMVAGKGAVVVGGGGEGI